MSQCGTGMLFILFKMGRWRSETSAPRHHSERWQIGTSQQRSGGKPRIGAAADSIASFAVLQVLVADWRFGQLLGSKNICLEMVSTACFFLLVISAERLLSSLNMSWSVIIFFPSTWKCPGLLWCLAGASVGSALSMLLGLPAVWHKAGDSCNPSRYL